MCVWRQPYKQGGWQYPYQTGCGVWQQSMCAIHSEHCMWFYTPIQHTKNYAALCWCASQKRARAHWYTEPSKPHRIAQLLLSIQLINEARCRVVRAARPNTSADTILIECVQYTSRWDIYMCNTRNMKQTHMVGRTQNESRHTGKLECVVVVVARSCWAFLNNCKHMHIYVCILCIWWLCNIQRRGVVDCYYY